MELAHEGPGQAFLAPPLCPLVVARWHWQPLSTQIVWRTASVGELACVAKSIVATGMQAEVMATASLNVRRGLFAPRLMDRTDWRTREGDT